MPWTLPIDKKMPLIRSRAKGAQKLCIIEGLGYANIPFFFLTFPILDVHQIS